MEKYRGPVVLRGCISWTIASAELSETMCDHVRYSYPNVCRWESMCQVGWGCWGVPHQAVEALGGETLRVGAGVRVETLLVVLERQWVDQLECWRDVDDAGDRGVGSDDELHW